MSIIYTFFTLLDRLLAMARAIDTFHPNGPACPLRYVGGSGVLECLRSDDLAEWEDVVRKRREAATWYEEYQDVKCKMLALMGAG